MSTSLDRAAPICAPTPSPVIVPFPANAIVRPVRADAAPSPMGGTPGMFVVWRHPDPALIEARRIAKRVVADQHGDWPADARAKATEQVAACMTKVIRRRAARLSLSRPESDQ